MKIIHYIPSLDRLSGGTTTYMQLLGEQLGRMAEVHIVSHRGPNPVEIKHCRLHYIPTSMLGAMKREWLAVIKGVRPDIVHVNCCWLPSCAFIQKWAQEAGYKVVLTPHGMLEPWIMRRHYWSRKLPALLLYQKRAICEADYLHATAESEKENLLKLGYNSKVTVIPNGIDVDSIQMKRSWERTKTILFLSRIHVKKGIDCLIEAAVSLRDELEGYQIVIAGEGDPAYIASLKQQVADAGMADVFNFVGGIYGDRKWDLFREADLFVLPTHSENFGLVVAEALACGTPVVTTQGTPWQELETRHCGWWTEIGSRPTRQALREFLLLDENTLKSMGMNGRKLVEEKYSSQKMAADMFALYNNLCF